MKATQYDIHPIANIFPMMSESDYQDLKEDIAKNGQVDPIAIWQGVLIDGRNRMRACQELQIEPLLFFLNEEDDPIPWVISKNLHRRHLTESQRALVAAKVCVIEHGGDRKSEKIKTSIDVLKIDDAAKKLNVSPSSVDRARQVINKGSEEVQKAVEQGNLPVSLASQLVAKVPEKEFQTEILKEGVNGVRRAVRDSFPTVDDDKKEEVAKTALREFKKLWDRCDAIGKKAIRVWLDEHYLD